VLALCDDRAGTKRRGENGKQFVLDSYNWERFYGAFREEMRRAEGASRKRGVIGIADSEIVPGSKVR
jgi:hypothetical protein